jgi:hypothetical protein
MTKDLLPAIEELIGSSTTADLIQNREDTLRQKLTLLLQMLRTRLTLHTKTASGIGDQLWTLRNQLDDWEASMHHGLPAPELKMQEAARSISALTQEERSRESDCWKDVVSLVRDILATWEGLQGAKARSLMLNDTGQDDTDDM